MFGRKQFERNKKNSEIQKERTTDYQGENEKERESNGRRNMIIVIENERKREKSK